jgi:hypothetical protein
MPIFIGAADVSFVNFDDPAELSNVFNERNTNFMAHEPSSLIGAEAHIPEDLQCAHALFADKHQVNNAIPVTKRLVRVLEDCAS